jgi:signal transduction histidine kinase
LRTIRTELAVTAAVAVLLATLLSFAVAQTITRPLRTITDTMKDVAATGDLTRTIEITASGRWEDADARLLATTFNTLTRSIARFQRETSQRERLLSLGRLSTVIAHEVRNPLMIIKAALHTLRRPGVSDAAAREAVNDVDGEVARLNRIVNEVLDFARPVSFELAPTDVNALCRDSAAAAQARPGVDVHLDLDPTAPIIVTDAERLRVALVNLTENARLAVETRSPAPDDTQLVCLSSRAGRDGVTILITDKGAGIRDADVARVFDPYFTTRRGGTGLGLPIAKNIIEGLGGTIAISTVPDAGTTIRIDLPAPAAAT